MSGAIALADEAIADMTDDAINAIALIVQTKIGQTDGGIASVYFSDTEKRAEVEAIIRGYLTVEESYIDHDNAVRRDRDGLPDTGGSN